MRLGMLTLGVALAALLILTVSDAGAAVAGLIAVGMLVLLGYRDGTWRALRWAMIVPASAIVADLITFTPLSPQTGPEADLYTYAAFFYLPVWALLVLIGVAARRLNAWFASVE